MGEAALERLLLGAAAEEEERGGRRMQARETAQEVTGLSKYRKASFFRVYYFSLGLCCVKFEGTFLSPDRSRQEKDEDPFRTVKNTLFSALLFLKTMLFYYFQGG